MAGGIDHDGHPYHFKVLGFPVHVDWRFFLIAVLLASSRTITGLVTWVVVVFASVLVHELGHALAFRAFGSPARIRLWSMGGLTYGHEPRTRWQQVVVSLAGPVPPLLLIGVPALLAYEAGVGDTLFVRQLLLDIWWANLFWSVVNLLPILPMDGGRLIQSLFGLAPARFLSVATALVASAFFFLVVPLIFTAVMALLVAVYNAYMFTKEQRAGVYVRDAQMRRMVRDAKASAPGARKAEATPEAAWAALEQGDVGGAEQVASRLGAATPPLLGATLAAVRGDGATALPGFVTALMVGEQVPPIADRILVESGLALPVADAIARAGDPRSPEVIEALQVRLRDRGHVGVAAEVAEIRAHLAGAEAGPVWYDVARTWARVGAVDRVVLALQRSAGAGHATSTMVIGDPSFTRMFDHPDFDQAVAALP